MKISLAMICEKWNLDSTKFCLNNPVPYSVFFTSIRVLPNLDSLYLEKLNLEDDFLKEILYLILDATSFTQNRDCDFLEKVCGKESCALLFLGKPEQISHNWTYAWIETEAVISHHQILNHLMQIWDYYDQYEKQLQDAVYMEQSIQKVVDLLCGMLGNPGYIVNRSFKAIAMSQDLDLPYVSINWKRLREQGYLPFDVVSSIIQNEEWDKIRQSSRPILVTTREFSLPFIVANLYAKNKLQWQFFATGLLRHITQGDLDLVNASKQYLRLLLTAEKSYYSFQKNYHENFLNNILDGKLQEKTLIEQQLRPFNWQINGLYCILELEFQNNDDYYDVISAWINPRPNEKAVLYQERILIIIALKEWKEYTAICQRFQEFLEKIDSYGGISEVAFGFEQLGVFAEQAKYALLSGKAFRKESLNDKKTNLPVNKRDDSLMREKSAREEVKRLFAYREYAKQHFLELLPHKMQIAVYLNELRYLQYCDRKYSTEYARTLYCYLRNERNLVKTAKEMHIHRNTLVYRIQKIEELLPLDLENPDIRFRLLLTWELLRETR